MARKKKAEAFAATERDVAEESSRKALDVFEAAKRERHRQALASRSMREIVERASVPPEAVDLPTDFAAAWATDRAELLKFIDRPLSAEETRGVAAAMAVLMGHNRRLRLLAEDLVDRLEAIRSEVIGPAAAIIQIVEEIRELAKNTWASGEDYIEEDE